MTTPPMPDEPAMTITDAIVVLILSLLASNAPTTNKSNAASGSTLVDLASERIKRRGQELP